MAEEILRIRASKGSSAAALIGELDLSSYGRAAAELDHLFRATGDVRLDLSELTFVDSSGIRLFIRLHQALEGRGRLVLASPASSVARVMEIAGLGDLGIRLEAETE